MRRHRKFEVTYDELPRNIKARPRKPRYRRVILASRPILAGPSGETTHRGRDTTRRHGYRRAPGKQIAPRLHCVLRGRTSAVLATPPRSSQWFNSDAPLRGVWFRNQHRPRRPNGYAGRMARPCPAPSRVLSLEIRVPGRTRLSTNATCQQERTENFGPNRIVAAKSRSRQSHRRERTGELQQSQNMSNVQDTDAVSETARCYQQIQPQSWNSKNWLPRK